MAVAVYVNPQTKKLELSGNKDLAKLILDGLDSRRDKVTTLLHRQMTSSKNPGRRRKDQDLRFMPDPSTMTTDDLRYWIPLMVRKTNGHGKPNWGIQAKKPIWWPESEQFKCPKLAASSLLTNKLNSFLICSSDWRKQCDRKGRRFVDVLRSIANAYTAWLSRNFAVSAGGEGSFILLFL